MTDAPKHCPFCGLGTSLVVVGYTVDCLHCGAQAETEASDPDNNWNTRPIEDALRAQLDAALARIAEMEAERD